VSQKNDNKNIQGWGLTVMLGIHSTPKMVPLHPMELYGRRIIGCVFGDFKGKSQLPNLVDKCVSGVRTSVTEGISSLKIGLFPLYYHC
jgi:Zn-dependent alcohol dehydrogenase